MSLLELECVHYTVYIIHIYYHTFIYTVFNTFGTKNLKIQKWNIV